MVVLMTLPETWGMETPCDRNCYSGTLPCSHAVERFGAMPGFALANDLTIYVISLLKQSPGSYQFANLIAYFVLLPAVAVLNGWLGKDQLLQDVA